MAPIRDSEYSILPTRSMPVGSTLEVTRLPAQGFPATKDVARGAASRKRGDGPPTHSICWEDYKPILRTLYIDEERPLREVMEIMENEFDFKATMKVYKSRFRIWGWRKNIRLDSDIDADRVQDVISRRPEDASELQAQYFLLPNGQLVDVGRLHRHLRRKRRYKEMPLTPRINQPDVFYNSEAIFYSVRSHTLGKYLGKVNAVTDALDLFTKEEPITGRWLKFTDEIQDLLQRQNLAGAIVQMRRAPDEIAAMVQTEPTALSVNLFMFIVKLCKHPAATHAESRQVRMVVKSLLHFAASLLFPGSPGRRTSHPLQVIIKGLANAPDSDLSDIAARAWTVNNQSWAELVSLDVSTAASEESMIRAIEIGDPGEKDGMWFTRIIEGLIDRTMAKDEATYGKRDTRCIEALQSKAELRIYINGARQRDCHLDPRLEELYLEILDRGAQGARRAGALKFLAESHRGRGELDMAKAYARLCFASMDSNSGEPSSVVLDEEMPGALPILDPNTGVTEQSSVDEEPAVGNRPPTSEYSTTRKHMDGCGTTPTQPTQATEKQAP